MNFVFQHATESRKNCGMPPQPYWRSCFQKSVLRSDPLVHSLQYRWLAGSNVSHSVSCFSCTHTYRIRTHLFHLYWRLPVWGYHFYRLVQSYNSQYMYLLLHINVRNDHCNYILYSLCHPCSPRKENGETLQGTMNLNTWITT